MTGYVRYFEPPISKINALLEGHSIEVNHGNLSDGVQAIRQHSSWRKTDGRLSGCSQLFFRERTGAMRYCIAAGGKSPPERKALTVRSLTEEKALPANFDN